MPGRQSGDCNVLTPAYFDSAACLNCGATLTGPFCAACGQRRATRLGVSTVRTEAWSRLRLFDSALVRSLWLLVRQPGGYARVYVLGQRAGVMQPLALLLVLIGLLVLLLGYTQYLAPPSDNEVLVRMFALVREYSKWSFSLGIVAIYLAAWLMFRGHLGYNATELLVLAACAHTLCLVLQLVNQLPLLVWNEAAHLLWHKRWTPYPVGALQAMVVWLAMRQFFCVQGRAGHARLMVAALLYLGAKWGVQQVYARAVVEVVHWQMGL